MSMVLQCKEMSKPHPEGVYSGVCVDIVDLGLVETDYQGQKKLMPKLRVFYETEYRDEAGKAGLISKTFTASLHPKAKLAEYLGKWRGRPVVPGEFIDLAKLVGACCTVVISHQQNMVGRTYAAIDAVSKPTKKVAPSGLYDPAETRRRIAEWKAKAVGQVVGAPAPAPATPNAAAPAPKGQAEPAPHQAAAAPATAPADFDPEVGF